MVGEYHQQLRDCAGCQENSRATEQLEKAVDAIAESAEFDSPFRTGT